MNLPFPSLAPRLLDSKWFTVDIPYDEDAELTAMEQANLHRLNSIGKQYMKKIPLGKPDPAPVEEEADTDEEEAHEESEETEESHDEDEEEDVPTSYTTTRNNNDLEPDSLEAPDLNTSDQSTLWPLQ